MQPGTRWNVSQVLIWCVYLLKSSWKDLGRGRKPRQEWWSQTTCPSQSVRSNEFQLARCFRLMHMRTRGCVIRQWQWEEQMSILFSGLLGSSTAASTLFVLTSWFSARSSYFPPLIFSTSSSLKKTEWLENQRLEWPKTWGVLGPFKIDKQIILSLKSCTVRGSTPGSRPKTNSKSSTMKLKLPPGKAGGMNFLL